MRILYLIVPLLIFISCRETDQSSDQNQQPLPGETIVTSEMEEGEEKNLARRQWMERMHRSAPGTDWRRIEYQNRMEKHRKKAGERKSMVRSGDEIIADGTIRGQWHERGSKNQAGSVIATEYDQAEDLIYLVAAGGTLFKGPRDGSNWQVVNQDFQFDGRFLHFLPTDSIDRLVAMIDEIVHYSDDNGISWNSSEGMETYDNNWGRRKHARVVRNDDQSSIVLLVQEWDPDDWSAQVSLFLSNDLGEHFTRMHTFQSGNIKHFALSKVANTEQLVLMEKGEQQTAFYDVSPIDSSISHKATTNNEDLLVGDQSYLKGIKRDSQVVFFSYNKDLTVLRSMDTLQTWEVRGQLPASPWTVGLYPVPSKPDLLLMGEVECHRSTDDGASWTKLNGWGEYYGDVANKLHADMMFFNEFETESGEHFLLISNHGGLNISYNYTVTTPNIGLRGLNVSQYYSVRTDPVDGIFLYAGSQDQGFQRSFSTNNEPLYFEQVISGDYGHIVFSEQGKHLWTVYPGGWVTYYDNPEQGGYDASYEINSNHESVWLPPMMSHPDQSLNSVYLAGGNIHGGDGSHLIELTADGFNIEADQLNYDFKSASGGEISAIEYSPLDPERLYVATTNGAFYYSRDGGQNWNESTTGLPEAQYLYGTAVYASQVDEETVYVGGSGYSNPPVYQSTDGGETFSPIDFGMPPTLVYDLSGGPEGKYLFAGTESGPYIRLIEDEKWYDMSGLTAPLQRYWSVEYLPDRDRVRFGTYGRGIWDFTFEEVTSVEQPDKQDHRITLFPNPCRNSFQIKNASVSSLQFPIRLFNQSGQLVRIWEQPQSEYDISHLSPGNYYLQGTLDGSSLSTKLFIQ